MNRALSLHADVAETGGTLLLEVAMGLREHRLRPETMVWSLYDLDRVRLRLAVSSGREHHLPALVERFRQLPGVTRVEIESEA
jgi:hypothetical protein